MFHATTQVVTALSQALRAHAAACDVEFAAARRGDSAAMHRLRVASRRTRAGLPVAAAAAKLEAEAETRDVRRVTRAFGPVRELDVVRELLVPCSVRHPWAASMLACVDGHCAALRRRALASAKKQMTRANTATLRTRLEALADGLLTAGRDRATTVALLAEVSRRARNVSVAMDRAGTVYGVDSLHRIRIAAKKLRYIVETADAVLGATSARAALRTLKRLQSRLGDIHDLQVVQRYLRIVAAAPGTTVAWRAQLVRLDHVLELECRRLHARLIARTDDVTGVVTALQRLVARRVAMRDLRRSARMRTGSTRGRAVGF